MVRGSMAKITRSQAEQIVTAYKEVREISETYTDVEVSKCIKEDYCTLALVKYQYGDVEIFLSLDGISTTIYYISYCTIVGNTLSIGGSGGCVDVIIIDD